jgi:hypothetical protein
MQLLRVTSLGLTVSLAVSATAQEVRMQGDPTGRDAVVRKSELTPEQKTCPALTGHSCLPGWQMRL